MEDSYGARDLRVDAGEKPFLAIANRLQLDGAVLHYCRYDSPVGIEFRDMPGFRQIICLSGRGSIGVGDRRVEVDATQSAIIPPTERFQAAYEGDYQHLVIQFDEAMLRRQAELLGHPAASLGESLPVLEPLSSERRHRVRDIGLALARQFKAPIEPSLPSVTQLTSALLSAFIEEFHPLALEPAQQASPALSERLRDYIHAHWQEALTVESVAAATGVSVRSVFEAFRRTYEVSPAAYLRNLRLHEAHRRLLESGEGSVIEIALACGFSSLGHFARRYRELYGELPSTTAARRPRP